MTEERPGAREATDETGETGHEPTGGRQPSNHRTRIWTELLDRGDQLIYVAVGIGFLLAAVLSLAYAVVTFVVNLAVLAPVGFVGGEVGGHSAVGSIITFVSNLLLTLIILEVMGTVVGYLRSRATSLKPFLYIGIISATRGILAVGARLSVTEAGMAPTEFRTSMVELGVNAAVIIALGITLRLIGRQLDQTHGVRDP